MQFWNGFKKKRFGVNDVFNRLAGHRLGQKSDEVAGMPRLERNADFAVRLEAADAGPVSCTRIENHERTALVIKF